MQINLPDAPEWLAVLLMLLNAIQVGLLAWLAYGHSRRRNGV